MILLNKLPSIDKCHYEYYLWRILSAINNDCLTIIKIDYSINFLYFSQKPPKNNALYFKNFFRDNIIIYIFWKRKIIYIHTPLICLVHFIWIWILLIISFEEGAKGPKLWLQGCINCLINKFTQLTLVHKVR